MLSQSSVVKDEVSAASVYDQRYQGDYRAHLSGYEFARWEALEHFIGSCANLGGAVRVLDYGAGRGLRVELCEQAFPHAELHFCDISSVARSKFAGTYPRQCRAVFPDR